MIIYTDGACSGNPGPGGFGIVVLDNNQNIITTHQEFEENTTNNRMELKAILWAIIKYGEPAAGGDSDRSWPQVYSDSSYCVNSLTSWMFKWENNNWLKSNKQPPENLDLIKAYFALWQKGYRINLQKVKGHSNNQWNDLADKLATGKIKQ